MVESVAKTFVRLMDERLKIIRLGFPPRGHWSFQEDGKKWRQELWTWELFRARDDFMRSFIGKTSPDWPLEFSSFRFEKLLVIQQKCLRLLKLRILKKPRKNTTRRKLLQFPLEYNCLISRFFLAVDFLQLLCLFHVAEYLFLQDKSLFIIYMKKLEQNCH